MASVFDSHDGNFTLTWLRSPDASFLGGATRAPQRPNPIVLAEGPHLIGAPSGAVGAGQWSVVGIDIPAQPGVAWVMVQALPVTRVADTADIPVDWWLYPVGHPTSAQNWAYSPVGTSDITTNVMVVGGYAYQACADPSVLRTCWIPLDPAHTQDGFQCVLSQTAPAGGWAADDMRIDFYGCKYLGYPINAWETGQLQAWAGRGS